MNKRTEKKPKVRLRGIDAKIGMADAKIRVRGKRYLRSLGLFVHGDISNQALIGRIKLVKKMGAEHVSICQQCFKNKPKVDSCPKCKSLKVGKTSAPIRIDGKRVIIQFYCVECQAVYNEYSTLTFEYWEEVL